MVGRLIRGSCVVVVSAALLAVVAVAGAFASGQVVRVQAAAGTVLTSRWHVGFFTSKHKEFCSWIATESTVHSANPLEAGGSSGSVCERWETPELWAPEQSVVEKGFTVSLFLTRLDVARVWLRVKRRGGGTRVQ